MIKRAKITASGKVQEVGYRQKVKEIADQLGVSGTIMNMEDGTVEILCEGEEQILADFIGKIKIQEKEPRQFFPAIWVDNLDVKMGKATREFRAFRKKNVTMDDSLEDMSHEVGIARGIMTNMAQSLSTSTQTLIEVNDNQRKTLESIETLTDHTDENFNKMESKYHKISIVTYALLFTISTFAVFGTMLYLNAIPRSMVSFAPVLVMNAAAWTGVIYITIKKGNVTTITKNM